MTNDGSKPLEASAELKKTSTGSGKDTLATIGRVDEPKPDLFRGESSALRMVLVGQALIDFDLRAQAEAAFLEARGYLGCTDLCFTNLETAIMGRHGGEPIKKSAHYATPAVLDCLKEMGFNALALSNNHTEDIGTQGILSTVEEVGARGFAFAGAGKDLSSASEPGYLNTRAGKVAIVAFYAGPTGYGSAGATESRPGVNEIRMGSDGFYHKKDVARALSTVHSAASSADYVLTYLHNHHWDSNPHVPPEFVRRFAHQCVNGGASLFVGHGIPLMHGLEIYRSAPVFYGLGNFIFQSYSEPGRWFPGAWESVVAYCTFAERHLKSISLRPIVLSEVGDPGPNFNKTRGEPRLAQGNKARAILHRYAFISHEFGTSMHVDPDKARVVVP